MINTTLVRYVLTAALRDRVLMAYAIALALGVCLSIFLSSAAIIEKDAFAVVFAAGGLRIVTILALVLFTVFYMRRAFDSKDVEFLLSRPVGRVPFLLSHSAAFSLLGLTFGIILGGVLYAGSIHNFGQGHGLWIFSMIAEIIIMVNTALFFSMVITSAVGASMASFAFYILCRMMGQILGIMEAGNGGITKFFHGIMQLISSVMPRLDLMGQTSWLLYGPDNTVGAGFIAAQLFIFTALILSASLIDLLRRQF